MYPKIPPKLAQEQHQKQQQKKQIERETLKKVMSEQLSKKFSDKNKSVINQEVNNLLEKQEKITVQDLQQLENKIKNSDPSQIQLQIQKVNDDARSEHQSVKSGYSKMSGATNFDNVDRYSEAESDMKSVSSMGKRQREQKQLQFKVPKAKNDLDFLSEENQWAAIMKYNDYLFKKQQQILKLKEKENKQKFKEELDKQVEAKRQIKGRVNEEDQAYLESVKFQLQLEDEKEKMKLQEAKDRIMYEKSIRDRQMKEILNRRKYEYKQNRALDNFLLTKLRQEMQAEQEFNQIKRQHQLAIMKKDQYESMMKLQKQKDDRLQDIQDNIKLQQAYCDQLDKQERERDETLKDREQRQKEFTEAALLQTKKDHWDKVNQMEQRQQKYEDRLEKKRNMVEEQAKERVKNQKKETKAYLMQQMKEKEQRKLEESRRVGEQAVMWKTDAEKFFEFENAKTQNKLKIMKDYQQQIKDQMNAKIQMKVQQHEKMAEHEQVINQKIQQDNEKYSMAYSQADGFVQ